MKDGAGAAGDEIVPVYVWQLPVRITHWLIALSILTLSVTGFYIGRPLIIVPGRAEQSFLMGWVKAVHVYVAYLFTCAVLARVIWMFTGNKYARWDKFLPVHRTRLRGMVPTFLFYTFVKYEPPYYVGHNPLAGFTYMAVFALYFTAIATGLMLRGVSADVGSLLHSYSSMSSIIGGLYVARWIHHIVMYLLLGFMVHHIYSAILMAEIDKNGTMDSIFSGFKWVPRRVLGPGRYRWLHRGEQDE